MSKKNEIKEFMVGKEAVKLAEFYEQFPNKAATRGVLNLMVKKGEIERVDTGVYKLIYNKVSVN